MQLLKIGAGDDELVDNADWVELSALVRADGNTSREDLSRAIHRARGLTEQECRELAEDAFKELADRAKHCVNADGVNCYPFRLSKDGGVLRRAHKGTKWPNRYVAYLFMLLTSRGDMSSAKRKQAGLDPTVVFETLCKDILAEFWGGRSSISGAIVFHDNPRKPPLTKFATNVQHLCERLCEGGGWRAGARSRGAGDGKLDLVVWRRFTDERSGVLAGFAQCKTGIHWRDHLEKLQPSAFCSKYMLNPLVVTPVRIYMIPHRVVADRWEEDTKDGGLLFDRCRIAQFSGSTGSSVLRSCRTWLRPMLRDARKIA